MDTKEYLMVTVGLLLSALAIYLLLWQFEQVFLVALFMVSLAIAAWKGLHDIFRRKRWPVWVSTVLGIGITATLWGTLWLGMQLIGQSATQVGPATLLIIFGALQGSYLLYKLVQEGGEVAGIDTSSAHFKLIVGGIIAVAFVWGGVYQLGLGGQWSNLGGIVGEAGYGAGQLVNTIGGAVGSATQGVANQLDPSRNPQTARIVCAWELFGGGGVYSAASGGGVSMSKCVQQKIGQNETTTESVRVTDPIELRLDNPTIEPFSDHIEVQVPLTNTFVTDIRGRPIDINASNVQATVTFRYLDKTVSYIQKGPSGNGITIPPGDTRTMTFAGSESDRLFPVKTIAATDISNDDIIDRLEDLNEEWQQFDEQWEILTSFTESTTKVEEGDAGYEENCKNGDGFSEGSGKMCADAYESELQNLRQELQQEWDDLNREARWFVQTFKIDTSDAKVYRVKFLAKSAGVWGTVQDADPCNGGEGGPCENIETGSNYPKTVENALGDAEDENYLIEGTDYRVSVQYSYAYEAEAAFTESSRWKGGNQLLKVWRMDAWQDLSFEERQAWQQENCAEVKKYGQELPSKQRTASLTTPVTPVMYTDCAASLFREFGGGGTGTIDITIGATVNQDSNVASLLKEDGGVEITEATTDCTGLEMDLADEELKVGESFSKTEGVGWIIDPARVQREVTIEGDRQTIGCQTDMTFKLILQKLIDTEYTVPVIG